MVRALVRNEASLWIIPEILDEKGEFSCRTLWSALRLYLNMGVQEMKVLLVVAPKGWLLMVSFCCKDPFPRLFISKQSKKAYWETENSLELKVEH